MYIPWGMRVNEWVSVAMSDLGDASRQRSAAVCVSVSVRDKTLLPLFVQVSKASQPGPRTLCLLASQRPNMSACGYVHITRCGASTKFNWTPSFDIRRSLLAKMWLQARLASRLLLYNWPFTSLVLTIYNTTTRTKIWQVCGVPFNTSAVSYWQRQPPEHPMTTAVFRDVVKGTLCILTIRAVLSNIKCRATFFKERLRQFCAPIQNISSVHLSAR